MPALTRSPIIELATRKEIRNVAAKLMRKANIMGNLPTPIDELIITANLGLERESNEIRNKFFSSMDKTGRQIYRSIFQKIRGIADLRERVIYVPNNGSTHRDRFVQGHELGHQVLGWHHINPEYLDDDLTLSLGVKNQFEKEANFFSAEILFQGDAYRQVSRDYRPEFSSIFHLSDTYDASCHAAWWRFIEESDEAIAGIVYWPSRYLVDTQGRPILKQGKVIYSPRFARKYMDIVLADVLTADHEWAQARNFKRVVSGDCKLPVNSSNTKLMWESWWNNYSLLVFLRRQPKLHRIRNIVA